MFEDIKEQSNYRWEKLEEKGEEEREYYKEVVQELKEVTENLHDPDSDKGVNKQRELIEEIVRIRAAEIIYLAYENTGGTFSGHVFVDPDTGDLKAFTWAGNTTLHPDSNLIQIYKLGSNWINNNSFIVNDILIDEEWEKLQEEYGDEADFLNEEQLESIGVDLDTRLMDYLKWCVEK